MNNDTHLPLYGIRVVEFSHMIMGPTCAMILADMGADVIKLEPPNGDSTRLLPNQGAGFFATCNRNKRSIAIDLATDEGKLCAKKLILSADVFVENMRPGGLKKFDLDYEQLKTQHPSLIYCALKGFLSGPYEDRLALDEVTQMMAGLAYMTGPKGRPLRAGASITDIMGGMFGVIAILAALKQRETTGQGQLVSSALFETTVHMVTQHMMQYVVTGTPAGPMPNKARAWAVYDIFQTKDEQQIFIGIVSDSQWNRFCQALELDYLQSDADYKSNMTRHAARDKLIPQLNQIFSQYEKDHLMHTCERIGLPFAPITAPHELFDDPHLNESGGFSELTLNDGRKTKIPVLPIQMNSKRLGNVRRQIPKAGEHTLEILTECGYSTDEINALVNEKACTIS